MTSALLSLLLVGMPCAFAWPLPRRPSDRARVAEVLALMAVVEIGVQARAWLGGETGARLVALAVLSFSLHRFSRVEPGLALPLLFPLCVAASTLAVPAGPHTDWSMSLTFLAVAHGAVRAPRLALLAPLPLLLLSLALLV